MSDYEADVSHIRSDAMIWSKAATDIDAPKTSVQGLTLLNEVWSAAADGSVVGLYEQIRKQIDTLLGGAKKSFNNISTTLENVATSYDNQESDGAANMSDAGEGMGS